MSSPILTEKVPSRSPCRAGSARGFTLVEVMVSMAITVIVMGSVFALLARGFRTTDAEFERSDLQAQARHALDQISRDLLTAGAGLPPEFPAFTPPHVNPELDASGGGPEAIEIVGYFDSSAAGAEPWPIVSFDGEKARAKRFPTHIRPGELVLLYDDEPTHGTWMFGLVSAIDDISTPEGGELRELTIKTAPGDTEGDTTLPDFIDHYNRPSPASGFITPVTVVSYKTGPEESGSEGSRVLWRRVNWGEAVEVALVEDLQFRYFMGTTVPETKTPPIIPPRILTPPLPPVAHNPHNPNGPNNPNTPYNPNNPNTPHNPPDDAPSHDPTAASEGVEFPLVPQPNPAEPLLASKLVLGVGVSVTSRSGRADLEGSTVQSGQSATDEGFLRVTYASRVAARNVMFRLSARENQKGFN
ncbi:MAG: PilW family protein [Vicinamibacteria bacterium]